MSIHEIPEIPNDTELRKLSSAEIEQIGADLTLLRLSFQKECREKQSCIQDALQFALEREQEARIANDPDYWEKHQGISSNPPRSH